MHRFIGFGAFTIATNLTPLITSNIGRKPIPMEGTNRIRHLGT